MLISGFAATLAHSVRGLQEDKAFISGFENEFQEVLAWNDEKYALMI